MRASGSSIFQGPLVPTDVTRAKQGRAEIDDPGLVSSFIGDVMFLGFGMCFGRAACLGFQWNYRFLGSLPVCLIAPCSNMI